MSSGLATLIQSAQFHLVHAKYLEEMCVAVSQANELSLITLMQEIAGSHNYTIAQYKDARHNRQNYPMLEFLQWLGSVRAETCPVVCTEPAEHYQQKCCFPIGPISTTMRQLNQNVLLSVFQKQQFKEDILNCIKMYLHEQRDVPTHHLHRVRLRRRVLPFLDCFLPAKISNLCRKFSSKPNFLLVDAHKLFMYKNSVMYCEEPDQVRSIFIQNIKHNSYCLNELPNNFGGLNCDDIRKSISANANYKAIILLIQLNDACLVSELTAHFQSQTEVSAIMQFCMRSYVPVIAVYYERQESIDDFEVNENLGRCEKTKTTFEKIIEKNYAYFFKLPHDIKSFLILAHQISQ